MYSRVVVLWLEYGKKTQVKSLPPFSSSLARYQTIQALRHVHASVVSLISTSFPGIEAKYFIIQLRSFLKFNFLVFFKLTANLRKVTEANLSEYLFVCGT